jgi:ATP-dependent RNA helicase DHX29
VEQVPQYILDEMISAGHGGFCNIVCTQPRRIAVGCLTLF